MVDASVGLSVEISRIVILDQTRAVSAGDGRAGVGGVVGCASVDGMVVVAGSEIACRNAGADGTQLGLLRRANLVLATEEVSATAGARGVVIGRRGPEALLLLVVADESDLHESGADEEQGADDGDGESGGVESAREAELGA